MMTLNTRYLPHQTREAFNKLTVNPTKQKFCITKNYLNCRTGCYDVMQRQKKIYTYSLKESDWQNSGRQVGLVWQSNRFGGLSAIFILSLKNHQLLQNSRKSHVSSVSHTPLNIFSWYWQSLIWQTSHWAWWTLTYERQVYHETKKITLHIKKSFSSRLLKMFSSPMIFLIHSKSEIVMAESL